MFECKYLYAKLVMQGNYTYTQILNCLLLLFTLFCSLSLNCTVRRNGLSLCFRSSCASHDFVIDNFSNKLSREYGMLTSRRNCFPLTRFVINFPSFPPQHFTRIRNKACWLLVSMVFCYVVVCKLI